MARRTVTDEDRREAVGRLLSGLAREDDVHELTSAAFDLHPPNNTFPGEVYLQLAGDALDLAGVTRENPIDQDGLRETHLPERQYRGKENYRLRFAILAAGSARGGVEPDVLDETYWWGNDDFWRYALEATVAIIRACAARDGVPVEEFAQRLAERE